MLSNQLTVRRWRSSILIYQFGAFFDELGHDADGDFLDALGFDFDAHGTRDARELCFRGDFFRAEMFEDHPGFARAANHAEE